MKIIVAFILAGLEFSIVDKFGKLVMKLPSQTNDIHEFNLFIYFVCIPTSYYKLMTSAFSTGTRFSHPAPVALGLQSPACQGKASGVWTSFVSAVMPPNLHEV
jgi:hypothetical protein